MSTLMPPPGPWWEFPDRATAVEVERLAKLVAAGQRIHLAALNVLLARYTTRPQERAIFARKMAGSGDRGQPR